MVNDSWCSGPQLKGTFSLINSLIGSDNSVSLSKNFDKLLTIPMKDCTTFLELGEGILMMAVILFCAGLCPSVV